MPNDLPVTWLSFGSKAPARQIKKNTTTELFQDVDRATLLGAERLVTVVDLLRLPDRAVLRRLTFAETLA